MLLPHETRHPNLYVPGLNREGRPIFSASGSSNFWRHSRTEQDRGGPGECYMEDILGAHPGPCGVAHVVALDAAGKVCYAGVFLNVITDLGAYAMLKAFGNTAPTPAPYVVLDTSLAAATLTSPIASATVTTTLPVAATSGGTAAGGNPTFQSANAASTFQSNASNNGTKQNNNNPGIVTSLIGTDNVFGTGISVSFGTNNEEGVAGSTTANNGTTINITSYTTARNHATNDWVVAHGSTADNPTTTPTGAVFSSAQTQAPSGTGIGQRSTVYAYTFNGSVIPAGTYTGLWLGTAANSGGWGAGVVYARASITPINVSLLSSAQISYTIKL